MRPTDAASGKLDEYAFDHDDADDNAVNGEKKDRPWDVAFDGSGGKFDEHAAGEIAQQPLQHPHKPNGRLRLDRAIYRAELVSFKDLWSRVMSKEGVQLMRRMIVQRR